MALGPGFGQLGSLEQPSRSRRYHGLDDFPWAHVCAADMDGTRSDPAAVYDQLAVYKLAVNDLSRGANRFACG